MSGPIQGLSDGSGRVAGRRRWRGWGLVVLLAAVVAGGRWVWPSSDVPDAEQWVRRASQAPDQVTVEAGQRLGTNALPGLRRVMTRDDTRWEKLLQSRWVGRLPPAPRSLLGWRLSAGERMVYAALLWQQIPGHRAWDPVLLQDALQPTTRNRVNLVRWLGADDETLASRLSDFLLLAADADPTVRQAAATVLGDALVQGHAGARGPEVRQTLETLAADQVSVVREVANLALAGKTRATEFE